MKRWKLEKQKQRKLKESSRKWHECGFQRHLESGLRPGLHQHTWGWRAKKTSSVPSLLHRHLAPKSGTEAIITGSQEGFREGM